MIITRTPLRLSLLGGGTDYPDHFRQHGGQTLGVAIDKYSYVTVSPLAGLFDYSLRVSYSRTELAGSPGQIEHPAVRECLRFMGVESGVEIHYMGDLPARTGLGSSSSFTVALLHALHALKGQLVGPEQLAREACHVEQERLQERVGVQDQYTCAHGGFLHLAMDTSGGVSVRRVPLTAERMELLRSHFLLVYTRVRRVAHEVLAEQLQRTREGTVAGELQAMGRLVDQGLEVLSDGGSLVRFGEILHSTWELKRSLSTSVSSPQIDALYERARAAGAIGGKLVGAGAGGFVLLFVPPSGRARVEKALAEFPQVTFGFDHEGSRLVFYQP